MNASELRILAETETAYVESRVKTYADDDTKPPPLLLRLGTLAKSVLECVPTSEFIDGANWQIRAEFAIEQLETARGALEEIGVVLSAVNEALDAAKIAVPAWPASGLRHGLVLVRGESDRRIFSEPIRGQYSVQTVAPSGETAGEPWSTTHAAWSEPEWREEMSPIATKPCLPRYDEAPPPPKAKHAKVEKPKAEDRTLPMFDASSVAPRKTIADYAPDDAQFEKWTHAISSAMTKAGIAGSLAYPSIDEKLRDVFASWKAANATEEKSNPAATFWHHAKTMIVGS